MAAGHKVIGCCLRVLCMSSCGRAADRGTDSIGVARLLGMDLGGLLHLLLQGGPKSKVEPGAIQGVCVSHPAPGLQLAARLLAPGWQLVQHRGFPCRPHNRLWLGPAPGASARLTGGHANVGQWDSRCADARSA